MVTVSCSRQLALKALVGAVLACSLLLAQARPRERAAAQRGQVQRVVDGDSFWFKPVDKEAVEVRLADIDAPELCQAHGRDAKAALAELVLKRPAELRGVGRDRFGRLVARMTVEGRDVAQRLVQEGQAWSARHRNDTGPLIKEERMARALRRGLHATPGAVLPRDFRRNHGPCAAHAAGARR